MNFVTFYPYELVSLCLLGAHRCGIDADRFHVKKVEMCVYLPPYAQSFLDIGGTMFGTAYSTVFQRMGKSLENLHIVKKRKLENFGYVMQKPRS